MSRKQINLTDSAVDVVATLSEGNPGGLRILCEIFKAENGLMRVLDLDDMNIRGAKIWVGFKYHCKENTAAFIKCIMDRDQAMVNTINEFAQVEEKAVTHGASFTRRG